jgi:hypothetical protein
MIDYNSGVRLVLKLCGVGLMVLGAVNLATYLPMLFLVSTDDQPGMYLSYVFTLLAPFLFGVLLWLFPAPIANSVVRVDAAAAKPKTGWADELERVGVSLLGLFLLYHALSDLVYHLLIQRAKVTAPGAVRAPDDFVPLVVATVVELALALFLLLRSKGIVNLLRKARGR